MVCTIPIIADEVQICKDIQAICYKTITILYQNNKELRSSL